MFMRTKSETDTTKSALFIYLCKSVLKLLYMLYYQHW